MWAERSSRRSEEHTSELQSRGHLVCRLLLEKKKQIAVRRQPFVEIGVRLFVNVPAVDHAYVLRFVLLDHVFLVFVFFFFNDTATTEIYTLSLHDALPISSSRGRSLSSAPWRPWPTTWGWTPWTCGSATTRSPTRSSAAPTPASTYGRPTRPWSATAAGAGARRLRGPLSPAEPSGAGWAWPRRSGEAPDPRRPMRRCASTPTAPRKCGSGPRTSGPGPGPPSP